MSDFTDYDIRRFKRMGLIGLFVFIAAFFLLSSCYTVDQGEKGVILRFGQFHGIAEPGINFKMPMADSVTEFSMRTEKRSYENLPSYSNDVQPANITVSVNWRVNPALVEQTYEHYGTTIAERILDPTVPKALKETFGQFQAATVVRDRTRLGVDFTNALIKIMPAEIIIDSVQIENVDFSDAYEHAIEAAMQAEADNRRKQNELVSTKIDAEKTVAIAKGEADSQKLRADAAAYTTEVNGKAEASAILARGAALRDNPQLVGLVTAEKWNGQLPATMLPGATLPFIGVH